MTMTAIREATVCECCLLVIANGDDSGCRDYYGHDHATCSLPGAVVGDAEGYDRWQPWTCEGCGTDLLPGATAYGVDVLERQHRHEYRDEIADWWCEDCQTVTDYCHQIAPR